LLITTDTARAVEQAFEACRTVFVANQAATEALYNTARRHQELAFHLARITLDAGFLSLMGGGAQQPDARWKGMMAGYVEVCHAGLQISQSMTGVAFKALQRAPAMLTHISTDGASAA
jgi:hypothetical protein